MTERPILFSTPMVRAILDGKKTMTRRVLRKQPLDIIPMNEPHRWISLDVREPEPHGKVVKCRYGQVGDRLWVRETFYKSLINKGHDKPAIVYVADNENLLTAHWKKYPSIFMPRWASRITLEITGVRVERLMEITEEDVEREGVLGDSYLESHGISKRDPRSAIIYFEDLWDSINGKTYPWESNPWVWCVSFKRVEATNGT